MSHDDVYDQEAEVWSTANNVVVDLGAERARRGGAPAMPSVDELIAAAGLVKADGAPASTAAPAPDAAGPVLEGVVLRAPATQARPAWMKDADTARDTIGHFGDWLGWHARYHAARTPVYAGRLAAMAVRGVARGAWWGCRYVVAAEFGPSMRAARRAGQWAEYRQLGAERGAMMKHRAPRAAAAVGLSVVLVAVVAAMAGMIALTAAGAVAFGAAVAGGRKEGQEGLAVLDTPEAPVRVDLAPDHLNAAFRACGLLPAKASQDGEPAALRLVSPILRDGRGWAAVLDLPRGSGKAAKDVLGAREALAAELGVDEIQLIMARVRASAGGHAGRLSLWVADDDPYIGTPVPSPLASMDSFDIWKPIPFGQDARGVRVDVEVMWQSMFFGGLPRRGKTFTQRLMTAAGLLDPYVRHYVADGKGGADWMPMRAVAHRLVMGAEDDAIDALKAMLAELITEMERRFKVLRDLPPSICPEGKLTPAIMRKYNLPVIFVTIDELQEYFTAMEKADKEAVISDLCRIARRGPAAGFISNYASQRPDADSVPTKLREIITLRYSTQVVDKTSSDMVLGKGKAAMGADASVLSAEHKGVGVLVTGPADFVTVKADLLDGPGFAELCQRGRELRIKAGQLTGDAAGDVQAAADAAGFVIPSIVSDVLDVMRHADRMHTTDILTGLVNLDDDTYGDWTGERLAAELDAAGVVRASKQVKIDNRNLAGYRRADIEGVIPPELTARG